MNFKSLNSAIRSVTNPQPKLVKEDYQTRERDRQIANLGKPVPAIDSKEKASKKVYGKDGRVEHKSLADMLKKANKKSTVKEEQEYIERLESALESIAEELECSVEDLLEDLPPKSHVDRIKKKTAQLSPEQRAAAMKDRNSSIHRTPAELKAHDAGMKAYVKSTNNRTDSKGKKLHPYDDYQS